MLPRGAAGATVQSLVALFSVMQWFPPESVVPEEVTMVCTRRQPSSSWSIWSDPSIISGPSHRNTCKRTWFPQHCALFQDHERFREQLRKGGAGVVGQEGLLSVFELNHTGTVGTKLRAGHNGRAATGLHSSMGYVFQIDIVGVEPDRMFPQAV
ncbi:hypothetical protein BJY52DRAFT_79666 [Lactarius psammicola]|nr:hypothetical protein BJY52DRAFT_79666 [Lactarius psammicola]